VGAWLGWLIPFAVLILIGVAGTWYLVRIRAPRGESAAGVAALAGMHWRDFIHLVVDALIKRGYERVFEPQASGEDGDYVLERDGQRYLLSAKHGAAYILGSTAIAELANSIRMRGVAGGLLVTPGQFAPEALPLARAQRIELLDGPTLWPELRSLLPEQQRAQVSAPSQGKTRQHVLLVWVCAVVVAGILFALLRPTTTRSDAIDVASTPKQTMPPPLQPKTALRPGSAVGSAVAPTDAVKLEQRRTEVSHAVATLPGVDRALWETQSTLLVYLVDDQSDPFPTICPLLERYEELAATRLQLQPPQGSTKRVRFVQCRAY
jgi:restriction system protein